MKSSKIVVLMSLACVTSAHAQLDYPQLERAAASAQPQVVEWRRWFHRNPELSNREFKTSKKVAEILRDMGLEPRTGIARTGVSAIIEGGRPGPLVAIRADMDALPVAEQTGLPFASDARSEYNGQDVGVMHACGHDAHMAMVLGAARVLNELRAELAGSVMLIFQPAEEGPPAGEEGGASLMLDEGLFENGTPEAVFGIHVGLGVPGGEFATKPGPMMAASDSFILHVRGKQTHGARPWDGVDPITLSAQIVLGLQTIASRQVDVTLAPSIISIGRINGGIRYNVIPDEVELHGTIRTFDPAMREKIHAAIERTASSIAQSAGATATLELRQGAPAVVNDARLADMMSGALERASGHPVRTLQPQTVAEDFSEFGAVTPSLFLHLGNWPEDLDPRDMPANHSPLFDFHEPYLERGVKAFAFMVLDYTQR